MRKFELVKGAPSDTKLPTRKTQGSAGYDFYLPADVVIAPGAFTKIIPTNVKAKMEKNEYLALHIRSSIGTTKHVTLANNTGIIDCDYYGNPANDGNIGIILHNEGKRWVRLKKGERIMQGIFCRYFITRDDCPLEKRQGGFGSTGR